MLAESVRGLTFWGSGLVTFVKQAAARELFKNSLVILPYGSVPGPLIGAIAFEFIRTYANKYAPYAWQMTLGIIMLLIILFQPGGLWAIYESVVARFSRHAEGVERA